MNYTVLPCDFAGCSVALDVGKVERVRYALLLLLYSITPSLLAPSQLQDEKTIEADLDFEREKSPLPINGWHTGLEAHLRKEVCPP